jgi:ubiquinol-cytochrome c reductase cytochrome b subunit
MGGNTVGDNTLGRLYAFHVFWLPAILFLFVGVHVYMVLHNGISEPPKSGRPVIKEKYREWYHKTMEKKGVPFFPDSMWHDIAFSVLVLGFIILLAFIVKAPKLIGPPDPTTIDVVPAPDWYLTWIFALYAMMPYGIEDMLIVVLPIGLGLILFALPFIWGKGERSPMKRPWSMAGVSMVVVFILAFWWLGFKTPWVPRFNTKPLPTNIVAKDSMKARQGVRLFYVEGCQYCHQIGPRGGQKGPNLTYVGDRLTKRLIKIAIINGSHFKGGMPAFGPTLSATQLEDLVAFLQTRKEGNVKGLKVLKKPPKKHKERQSTHAF